MIAQLRGILVEKTSTEIVVDCGGVGYVAAVSVTTSSQLPSLGEKVVVPTLMVVREDAIQLFGFCDDAERSVFKLLISIPGIGPKIALGILSSISLVDLRDTIASGNLAYLQKLPGIGKKTAERILIELRDKIGAVQTGVGEAETMTASVGAQQEAIAALVALGYTRPIAEKAIRQALADNPGISFTADVLIRKALRSGIK